jgi:hypothetical protein
MEGTRGGERVQEKYLRRVLEVDREMPGYIVREECKRNSLRVKVRKSACRILRECWREKKNNTEKKERERNTPRGTGMPVNKWKDGEQKKDG